MDTQERQTWELVRDYSINTGGCPRVEVDPRLVIAARAHSLDLAQNPAYWDKLLDGYPGHVGSDNSTPGDRITKATGSTGAENVFRAGISGNYPPPSPQQAFDEWRRSTAHDKQMRNCAHRYTGVGIAVAPTRPDGWTYYYFTQDFQP
ncbi:CAP domain-containing protein [Streptomyces sp. NPDC002215]|uniref:CAP domain-containing protein n=1 Tax=Streptomyces sp. NPDC002215 TaxID=3154412 RepID=UPI00331E86AF